MMGCTMSHSTIGRILKMHALRPHLRKYFLTITDPEFFPKMEHIIELYLNSPEYLFCFDECTGIQAIQRLAPDFPVSAGSIFSREFQYKRNGTTDLTRFSHTPQAKEGNGAVGGRRGWFFDIEGSFGIQESHRQTG